MRRILKTFLNVTLVAVGCPVLVTSVASAAPESGIIEGTVFRDYDQTGVQGSAEPGRDGIEVRAYDDFGNVAGPVVSGADGTYSLPLSGLSDLNGSRYRIEFDIPESLGFLQSGPVPDGAAVGVIRSGSSVQFSAPTGVVAPGSAGVDFGVANPSDFCGSSAGVALSCFVDGRNGVPSGPNFDGLDTLISFDHDAPVARTTHATSGQTGATWGLAYRDTSSTVFASAITKRHTKYGAGGGPSSIWMFDPADTATAPVEFLNLDATLAATFTNPRTEPVNYLRDPDVWDAVGKTGLGDLDISDDETTLYTTSLEHRTLIEIPIGAQGPGLTVPVSEGDASSGGIESFAIPSPCGLNGVPGIPNDMRPWAVDVHDGLVYVGMVCSGESTVDTTYYRTAGNPGEIEHVDFQGPITNDSTVAESDPFPWEDATGVNKLGDWHSLSAHVYSFDPTTESFSAAPVFSMPLDFDRGFALFIGATTNTLGNWNPWVPEWTADYVSLRSVSWAQPILADIDFDGDDMLIAFNDRSGHQFGQLNFNTDPASTQILGNSNSSPDLLRACTADGVTWTLEDNSACPLGGGFAATGGAGSGEGPGGGEFFFDDTFRRIHAETAGVGGIMQIPGNPQVVTTSYDFSTVNQGSVEWFNNTTGESDRGFSVYIGKNPQFGKAAGLGDIEVLCSAAPVQIGNLVWFDADRDGIQDPSEPAISNVTVTLIDPDGNPVGAPILTGADGEYYFDIEPNAEYTVTFDLSSVSTADLPPGVTVADLVLTLRDAVSGGQDQHDSDGYLKEDVFTIDVGPHLAGHNDYTFDIGFNVSEYDLALIKTVSPAGPVAPGSTVLWTVRVENQGTVESGDFTVTDTLPTGLTYVSSTIDGGAVTPTQVGQVLTYSATDMPNLAASGFTIIVISATVDDVTQAPFRNWAEISSDSGDDVDSIPDTDTGADMDSGTGGPPASDSVINHNDPNFDSDADTPLAAGSDEDDNDYEDIDVLVVYDLALVKTTPTGVVDATDSIVWNVRVRNQGNVPSGEFTVVDTIPTGLVFASADGGGTESGGVVTWVVSELAPGTSVDLSYSTTISDVGASPFRNWAEIGSDSAERLYGVTDKDSVPDTDTGSDGVVPNDDYVGIDDLDDVNVDQVAGDEDDNDDAIVALLVVYDLALVKTTPTGVVDATDSIVWNVRVRNQGNVPSGEFTVVDTIPTGLVFASADGGGTESGGVVTWVVSELAPGTSVDLSYSTTISDVGASPFRNWAEIGSDSAERLYGVTDKDSVPDTDTGSDGVVPNDDYVGIDDLDDVNVDQVAGDEDDNDDAIVALLVVYDLALVKTTPTGVVDATDSIVWNVRVRNQGNVPSGEFTVVDTIPTGLVFASADGGGTESGGVVTWVVSELAPGTSVDLSYSTTISDVGASPFRNWAEIGSDSAERLYGVTDKDSVPDTDTGSDGVVPNDDYVGIDDLDDVNVDQVAGDEDDNDDAIVALLVVYDLALVKTTPTGVVDATDSIVWNVRVRNQGNVPSGEFTVVDTIPTGLVFASADGGGTESGGVVTWVVSELAPGTSVDLSYSTTISDVGASPFRNWAEIGSDSAERLYGVTDKDSVPDTDTGSDGVVPNDDYVGIDDLDDVNVDQVAGDEDDNDDAIVALEKTRSVLASTGLNSWRGISIALLLWAVGLAIVAESRRRFIRSV